MKKYLALLLLVSYTAFGQTTPKKEPAGPSVNNSAEWLLFEDEDYSISYPSDWQLDQSGLMGLNLIIFSPLESSEDSFRENINVIVQDIKGENLGLQQYAKLSEDMIKKMLTNVTILESTLLHDSAGEYYKMKYKADQGIYHMAIEQWYRLGNDKAYCVTFATKQAAFTNFDKTGKGILESFRIKE